MSLATSLPSLSEFNPHAVPYQFRVIRDVRTVYDYSLGTHEVLLSGSVGSAKSVLMAHLAVTHCAMFDRSRFCLARQAMPDLKETILQTVIDHMEGDLVEGVDYELNRQKGKITLSNSSEIVSRSWADKKFKRFRSVLLSGGAVEELTENGDEMKDFYPEMHARIGRLPHVPEKFLVSATNPDSPAHWAYKRFFVEKKPTRHVFLSRTEENPFLPPEYVTGLRENLDPKMALRLLEGQWIEIGGETVYHAYDRAVNFRDYDYAYDPAYPIRLNFDFNIGVGKPMSACSSQHLKDKDEFHFGEDYIVEGTDIGGFMKEVAERGLFENHGLFIIHGDATGKNRHPASNVTCYQAIKEFLDTFVRKDGSRVEYEIQVPRANPPIKVRHRLMNAYMCNALGRNRFFVYRKAAVLDEGCRLTKLKKGATYIEDDTPYYQHVTTAAGYGLVWAAEQDTRKSTSSER